MKKSKLRKIIRESIKELMNEHTTQQGGIPGHNHNQPIHMQTCATIEAQPCANTPSDDIAGQEILHECAHFETSGAPVTPQVGDVFSYPNQYPGIKFEVTSRNHPTGTTLTSLNKEISCTGTPPPPPPPPPTPPLTGQACISQRIQYTATNAHIYIMNAPASNNWKNNTIQTFEGYNCGQVQSRMDSMLIQINQANALGNPFSGNNLARKWAKINSLGSLNTDCCQQI